MFFSVGKVNQYDTGIGERESLMLVKNAPVNR